MNKNQWNKTHHKQANSPVCLWN